MIELPHGVIVTHAHRIRDALDQASDRVGPMNGDEPINLLLPGRSKMHDRRFSNAAADFHIVILRCGMSAELCDVRFA